MLDFIRSIRENLKDPKKKAITQLILYAIFFAIVFLLLANAGSRHDYVEPIKEKVITYDYIYNININNVINNTTGKSSDENDFYTYNKIKELIDKSEFIEKTTYKDNNTKTIYNIKAIDYYDECVENCDNVIVITVYEKEYIDNVVIDLTGITNYPYIIDIKYENIESK